MSDSRQYVIIGTGVAGISAAQEIRAADASARIVLIGNEPAPFYYRGSLSEWISGKNTDAAVLGRTAQFYTDMRIEQVSGFVDAVEPAAQRVHLADGTWLPYDTLLIATGARADAYPVDGLEGSLVFRSLADARAIKERLGEYGRALIIGGGVLGLELAGALHHMKMPHTAIVQRSAPLGKPLLDADAAGWLGDRMRADGVDLFIDDTVTQVEGRTAHLKSGQTWAFDAVIQAVGITPVYPEVPGIEAGKGIRIDAHSRTNLPGIYAAGDCTETRVTGTDRWQTTRTWLESARQGRAAGRSMVGLESKAAELPFFNASLLYTYMYAYIGEPHAAGGDVSVWQQGGGYRKLRVVDGRLAGALLLGNRRGSIAMWRSVGHDVAAWGESIAAPEFDWNALTGRDWDQVFF